MLSREYRTIFVHIPKTGGQSIERVFLRRHNLTWEARAPLLLRPNADPLEGPPRLAHLLAREYVSCGHVSQRDFDDFFKFGAVRNPWARAVSAYKYMVASQAIPFGAFVRRTIVGSANPQDARQVAAQTQYLCSADGVLLVDRVLRFENLAAEFGEVSRKIFGREEKLPLTNVSPDRRDYREFYDDATAEIVAKVYADDIATFGYKFDVVA